MPIRILIVDAYAIVRKGVRLFLARDLDLEVIGEAADGQEASLQASWLRPDLILIDLMLPGQDGLSTIAALHQALPCTIIVVLSSVLEPAAIRNALRAGASGYLSKDIRASELRAAVKAAAVGQFQLSPAASASPLVRIEPSEHQLLTYESEIAEMRSALRWRFWLESALAVVASMLFVVTLVWRDWIEIVFNVDPDNRNGTLEWFIVVAALFVVAITLIGLAGYEIRRARVALS